MKSQYWMIHTSNKFSVLGLPMPFSDRLRHMNTFFWKGEKHPTLKEITEKAEQLGIKKDGFSVHAISRVPNNYRNFGDPDVIVITDES